MKEEDKQLVIEFVKEKWGSFYLDLLKESDYKIISGTYAFATWRLNKAAINLGKSIFDSFKDIFKWN